MVHQHDHQKHNVFEGFSTVPGQDLLATGSIAKRNVLKWFPTVPGQVLLAAGHAGVRLSFLANAGNC